MGWDTNVIVIGERIKNRKIVKDISTIIFKEDSKSYGDEIFYIINEDSTYSFFYTYERRKYLPYWVIKKISQQFPKVQFTILGSCPDFVGGPAGIIRILEGKFEDSYAIGNVERNLIRENIISNIGDYQALIYDYFKRGGDEELLRNEHTKEFPKICCNDIFFERLIPIEDSEKLKVLFQKVKKDGLNLSKNWTIQPPLKQ